MSDKLSERLRNVAEVTYGDAAHNISIWADEAAALEQRVERLERQIELALNAIDRAQPTTHELDGAIVIWETAWNEAQEALASEEEA